MDDKEENCLLGSKQSACEAPDEKQEKVSREQKTFRCEICGKVYNLGRSLKKHVALHIGLNKFKCHICGKEISQRHHLKGHLRTHERLKEFKCDLCGKEFSHKSSLISHLRVHTGIKEFKCHVCSKEFSQKSYLNLHLKLHTGIKEFKCPICSMEFFRKCYLNVHVKKHRPKPPKIKEHKCHLCIKVFKSKDHLTRHIKTHNKLKNFKCHVCSKEFTVERYLVRHLTIHSATEKLKCEFCSKAFRYKYDLKKHEKTHPEGKEVKFVVPAKEESLMQYSGDHSHVKEFRCHMCEDVFSDELCLQQHILRHSDQVIDVQSSSSCKEDVDKPPIESDPDVDPLLIEDEIPRVVEVGDPDITLSKESPSMFGRKALDGNERSVNIENNVNNEALPNTICGSEDVVGDAVKVEVIDFDINF